MLAFVLLAARDGRRLAPDSLASAARDAEPYLPFRPETQLTWTNRSGTLAVLGWQALTANAGLGSHWSVDPAGGLTLFSGHCWPRRTGWDTASGQSWAEQLSGWLDRQSGR